MAVQAAITIYKQEMIAGFERRRSMLSTAPMKESMKNGLNVVWLVTSSGGAKAVTRGQNGLIPYGQNSNTQITATLVERHAPFEITGFDVFASQGNQTQALQDNSYAVIRREMDDTILTELGNATQDYGVANTPLDIATILGAQAALGYNNVDISEVDNMFCIVSPGAMVYLMQTTEFASGDYVSYMPYDGGMGARQIFRWSGMNFIVSTAIVGAKTTAELLYIFHRNSIGYATWLGEEKIEADYDRKQDVSWSRATIYHTAKILQDSGIVKITHDGSNFVTT